MGKSSTDETIYIEQRLIKSHQETYNYKIVITFLIGAVQLAFAIKYKLKMIIKAEKDQYQDS